MSLSNPTTIEQGWHRLLLDAALARNYNYPNILASAGGPTAPNPILNVLLPTLVYLRAGAFLDEVLEDYIDTQGLVMGKGYKSDLNGRIRFLADTGHLSNGTDLHALRSARNGMAHETTKSCAWHDVDSALNAIEDTLAQLAYPSARPAYEFYGKRDVRLDPEPDVVVANDFTFGVKVGAQPILDIKWSVNYHAPKAE